MVSNVTQPDLERLEAIIDRVEEGVDQIDADELREIAKDLETGKQYKCATCTMYCAGEDVMVIYDTESEEFIQIEVPMDEDTEITVSRAA